MAIEMTGEVPYEEVERRVREALGRHYQVTRKSDSVIKVRRFPFFENIQITWEGDRTTLQAVPGSVWIMQGINALTIHQPVRHSLSRALVKSS